MGSCLVCDKPTDRKWMHQECEDKLREAGVPEYALVNVATMIDVSRRHPGVLLDPIVEVENAPIPSNSAD